MSLNWRQFVAVVLPILGLVGVFTLVMAAMVITGRHGRTVSKTALVPLYSGAVGSMFFVLGAVPGVGYFGHEYQFFQYQWALLPLALAAMRWAHWSGLGLLLALHAGGVYLSGATILRERANTTSRVIETRVGPIYFEMNDPRANVVEESLALARSAAPAPTLLINRWGGGGWYVAAESPAPRNMFFALGARTPFDQLELMGILNQASVVIAHLPVTDPSSAPGRSWLRARMGADAAAQLLAAFEVKAQHAVESATWVIFTRRQESRQ